MNEFLFSYGTLQKDDVQKKLLGRSLYGVKDILEGYKLASIDIEDENFLAKSENKIQNTLVSSGNKNDIVNGTVLELTNDELIIADKYEPENYKRIKVTLKSGKGAWIYIAV